MLLQQVKSASLVLFKKRDKKPVAVGCRDIEVSVNAMCTRSPEEEAIGRT